MQTYQGRFQYRNIPSSMGKQPCCDNVGHNRGPWTVEEDHKLTNFILNNGIQNWRHVPKLAGLVRCGKSCRLRWMNHLRPDLKKGAFTEDEEYMLIKLQSQLGNRWSKIAAQFPGRTDNEIKNHWNTRIKKKLYTEQTRDIKEGSTKQKYSGQQSLPSLEYFVKDQQQLKEPIEISEMGSNDVIQNSEAVETISIERNGNNMIKAVAADERHNLDHLQRQSKHQSHQPRKRSVQMAPVGLWDRFPTARTVQQMMETMDRIMEDPSVFSSRGRTPWEIKESEGEYKMRFDMPGMTKEDVKVWVEEKMLVVKAEKKTDENISEKEEEWSARSYGKYNSRIALPENVEFENIKAEVRDGVLYLTIPKASSPKVFDINVQ